jgi:nucleoside-diphosphate-sugar epimerase
MRALVSGSTGFSGGFLCAALRTQGFEVHAVSQRADVAGVERVDLTSSEAWARVLRTVRPDHVFHLSGVMYSAKLSDLAQHNAAAAGALLDAALANKPPGVLLLVGSAAEYGIVPEAEIPVVESFPASPRMPYGATKYAQTQLGLDAGRRGLRVRDVSEAFVALAKHPNFSGIVNVSSATHLTMRSVLDQLITSFGLQVSIEIDAARLRAAEVQKFSASNTLLKTLIGERSLIPLATSLRDLVDHERAQTA